MKNKTGMNRRNFIKKSTSSIAGMAMIGSVPVKTNSQKKNISKDVIFRNMGKTGFKVPIISMGVMNADNPAVMKAAYEKGVRHFDTAWRYQNGRNEEMVGKVIKEMGIRDKIVLATKVPLALSNHSSYTTAELEELRKSQGPGLEKKLKEDYIKTFEQSLARLQLDNVDILYVHSVKDAATITWPFLLEALTQLKKQGKVKHLGISSHQNAASVFEQTLKNKLFEVILAPFSYKISYIEDMKKVLKKAREQGVAVVAMKTQGVYRNNKDTHHTAALKYVMQHDYIDTAIPGFTSFDQLEQNFSVAYDLEYTPEEEKYLKDFWTKRDQKKLVYTDIPCQGCEGCLNTCTQGVSIPDLMRTYMYTAGYNNFEHARITYDLIPEGKNLKVCNDCIRCTAVCKQGLNIPQNIRDLSAIFG